MQLLQLLSLALLIIGTVLLYYSYNKYHIIKFPFTKFPITKDNLNNIEHITEYLKNTFKKLKKSLISSSILVLIAICLRIYITIYYKQAPYYDLQNILLYASAIICTALTFIILSDAKRTIKKDDEAKKSNLSEKDDNKSNHFIGDKIVKDGKTYIVTGTVMHEDRVFLRPKWKSTSLRKRKPKTEL